MDSNNTIPQVESPVIPKVFTPVLAPVLASVPTLHNSIDNNTYVIALNASSNAHIMSFFTLLLVVLYIIIMYAFSFIYVPINTISQESHMVYSLLFNPGSSIDIFNQFVKSKLESFSNISDNSSFLGISFQPIAEIININFNKMINFINYWFHRSLLYFYIHKNTITTTI
jgi:hypothetical protein